jgi:hypothetical protein
MAIEPIVEDTAEELVFVPSSGFSSAQILETPASVVFERDGATLTASLVSDRDCTTLHFTVLGFDPPPGLGAENGAWRVDGPAQVRDDHGREVAPHPRWQTAGMIRQRSDASLMLDWQLKLERLPADVRTVHLSFGGPAGDWAVELPLRSTRPPGMPATRIAAKDTHHGIAMIATALARSSSLTAIEVETVVAPDPADLPHRPKRYVQGIGSHQGGGRLSDELLVLRDNLGNEHRERGGSSHTPAPRNRQVVQFPALPEAARSAVLEIPFVAVQERTDEMLSLPVPSENDIELEGCAAHALVSRGTGHRGSTVRVEILPLDPDAERELLYFNQVEVEGGSQVGMTIQHCVGEPIIVDAPDPTGAAASVTLRGPVLKLRGPWKLEVPLPGEEPAVQVTRSG